MWRQVKVGILSSTSNHKTLHRIVEKTLGMVVPSALAVFRLAGSRFQISA